MGTPTQVCVWSCPNFSTSAGRPFRCVKSKVCDWYWKRKDVTQGDCVEMDVSSRVPVPLPKDPYEAIRQAYLDGTNNESDPFEDPIDTETPESPIAIAPPILLSESTPPILVPILHRTICMAVRVSHAMSSGLSAGMAEVAAMSESTISVRVEDSEEDDDEEDKEIEESMDSDSVSDDAEDEGPTAEDENPAAEDESDGLVIKRGGVAVPRVQQQAAPVVGMTMSAPLGLGYRALRRHELTLEEGDIYSTFEVGQGSRSAPESERPERVPVFRHPTLTTWTDPKDGMIYIDIPDYPPPTPPIQTPPSPEWTSGSLPISPSHFDVPSPISSPMVPLTVPSPVATPATAEIEGFRLS
ncbi:hypothetical protein Tco_1485342 [Tanacetum coccineum]